MNGFVVRLVMGILAVVFLPLGVAFAVIGLAGGPDPFTTLGIFFAAVGAGLALAWLALNARSRAALGREAAARTARAPATVEEVELHPYIRIGSLVTATITVRFPANGSERSASRRMQLSPLLKIETGQAVEVAYDPADPANFVLLA